MTEAKTEETPSREATPELRRWVLLALEAAGIDVRVETHANAEGESAVVMQLDDLVYIWRELVQQHANVHGLRESLREQFPIVRVFEGLQNACDAHHETFPVTVEMQKISDEVVAQRVKAQAAAAQTVLSEMQRLAREGPPKDEDLN